MEQGEVKNESPIQEILNPQILMLLGAVLSLLGAYLLWQILVQGGYLRNEWTSEEKKQALTELIERAKSQGVKEPTREEKLRALQAM